MSILKVKLQIFLVGFIVYQGALYFQKKENGYTMPNQDHASAQQSGGFISPAYANENTGLPIDIDYDPYTGSSTSDRGQMRAAAHANAQSMVDSGNTSSYQNALMDDPVTRELMGFE